MLKKLKVKNFKSLFDVEVEFPRLTVLFGPNTAGKSNLLDAVQALSRVGTSRTLSDALSAPIRGYAYEAFSFPKGGLPELISRRESSFEIEADLEAKKNSYRYKINVGIHLPSGTLSVQNEYLVALNKRGGNKERPRIEKENDQLIIRRRSKPGNPRKEPIGLPYALLSDSRFGGNEYRTIETVREELSGWKVYYLDPRVAMRTQTPPSAVQDIGILGSNVAAFLFRLQAESPKHFETVKRTLKSLIPSIDDVTIDLNEKLGNLDLQIFEAGTQYSSRVISEGTLRVLALCAIVINPWSGSLIALEEPENGVHPRRLELITRLISSLALEQKKQVIVTTHSPLFCDFILKLEQTNRGDISLLNVRRGKKGTEVQTFDEIGGLFQDREFAKAFTDSSTDGIFENLLIRGLIDE